MVEALAASQAISFVREIIILRVVVEGGSLQVIKAINNTKPLRLLSGISLMRLNCCLLKVHVRHEGNKLAHTLTRRAVLFADTDVWLEDLPRDLDDVFQFDLL